MKTCKTCKVEKPFDKFYKNPPGRTGFRATCKACCCKKQAERKAKQTEEQKLQDKVYAANYRKENKEKIAAWHKNEYENNAEYRERIRRQGYERYHAGYKIPKLMLSSAWKRDNLDKIREYNSRRRAFKVAAGGTYTTAEISALLERQNYCCANPLCGADLRVVTKHIDHIKALSAGGANTIENLQWLCQPCNLSKGARDFDEWIASTDLRRYAA